MRCRVRAVSVVKDGRLVHDRSWAGATARMQRRVYSITKSLTSLLVGLAVDDQVLGLDQRASELIDEWRCGDRRTVVPAEQTGSSGGSITKATSWRCCGRSDIGGAGDRTNDWRRTSPVMPDVLSFSVFTRLLLDAFS